MDNNLQLIAVLVADRQRAFFDYAECDRRGRGVRRRSLRRWLTARARRSDGPVRTEVPTIDTVRLEAVSDQPSNPELERPRAA